MADGSRATAAPPRLYDSGDTTRRVLTMAIALPALALLLTRASLETVAAIVAIASAAVALELTRLLDPSASSSARWLSPGASAVVMWCLWSIPSAGAVLFYAGVIVGLGVILQSSSHRSSPLSGRVAAVFGGTLPFAAALVHRDGGAAWTAMLLAITWGGDVAGYVVGRLLGRRRLAPRVSPNKTMAGAIAALATGLGAGAAFGASVIAGLGTLAAAALGLVAGAIALAGDLVGSVIKRRAGVKDSGSLIPGHGGTLDVLDGIALAAPFLLAALLLISR